LNFCCCRYVDIFSACQDFEVVGYSLDFLSRQ
jgi:hypothetical protein